MSAEHRKTFAEIQQRKGEQAAPVVEEAPVVEADTPAVDVVTPPQEQPTSYPTAEELIEEFAELSPEDYEKRLIALNQENPALYEQVALLLSYENEPPVENSGAATVAEPVTPQPAAETVAPPAAETVAPPAAKPVKEKAHKTKKTTHAKDGNA